MPCPALPGTGAVKDHKSDRIQMHAPIYIPVNAMHNCHVGRICIWYPCPRSPGLVLNAAVSTVRTPKEHLQASICHFVDSGICSQKAHEVILAPWQSHAASHSFTLFLAIHDGDRLSYHPSIPLNCEAPLRRS